MKFILPFLFLAISTQASAVATTEYNGRLVVFCKGLPVGERVFSAKSVEVSGQTIKFMEYDSKTGEEVTTAIPTADCVISADATVGLIH